mmetsp:Transcript_43004/g.111487  ORF Transcript_43004/g.111487 Transcript_43004/m.111487 type:complete len:308 (+) Transcript_43004:43-966(+)|eukprot:CAMPEP_0203863908 /NCGR_PEP_ID=MMETSP0359-20131031/14444_1 /ASSEMBLY_ACC=CAM_ASM_000338 /TAXON_ID=268821 /ORGANISM="Scrippsiella Hangoei, Strain SHTV-5" /LENGTH=307 /DNA_ID=CAMNT_0050781537 /DNA_START=43 /DNA_END=966 /DNA_ORIENTATION=+
MHTGKGALDLSEALEQEVEEVAPEDLRIVQVIGHGSTGEVYMGFWKDKEVAIKQIQDPWGPDTPSSPFTRELFVLSRVRHPNVVRLLGMTSITRPLAFVMELCRGGSCADYIHVQVEDEKPLTWPQTFRIAKETASAMHYLHTLDPPIIHRDLKSMNLLLVEPLSGPNSVPSTKVCDFGVARCKASGEEGMTARATDDDWPIMTKAVGTCNWVAPEVFRGHSYDEKIDVYAFAMVLFELTFHELPFEDSDPIEITALVTNGRRPCLQDPPPGCPKELLGLVERCWAHHPDFRPTFRDVLAVLDAFPG